MDRQRVAAVADAGWHHGSGASYRETGEQRVWTQWSHWSVIEDIVVTLDDNEDSSSRNVGTGTVRIVLVVILQLANNRTEAEPAKCYQLSTAICLFDCHHTSPAPVTQKRQ